VYLTIDKSISMMEKIYSYYSFFLSSLLQSKLYD
jgi:hypothetical protein